MNANDSEQIRKKLEEEYNENCSRINELDEKIRIIDTNDFDTKVTYVLTSSIIPYIASLFLMPFIVKLGIISLNMVQPLFVGVTVLIGITGEELFARKAKYREKFRKFSKSKTQKEMIEESTKYEIEKEKLKSLNKILKKNYDYLLANENNIIEKDVGKRTKEEIFNSIENINNVLQKKLQKVDVATTKSVLKEKFRRVRNKFNRFSDFLIDGIISGMMSMFLYDMPIMYLNEIANIQIQTNFLGIIVPAIIGGLAFGGCSLKRTNDYTAVFKIINNQLGDNAISEFRDYAEDKQFDKDLEDVIRDTSDVKIKLELEIQKLNHTSESSGELYMHNEAKNVQMDYAKSETPLENMISFMEESISEEHSKEQGPILKKTMNSSKK